METLTLELYFNYPVVVHEVKSGIYILGAKSIEEERGALWMPRLKGRGIWSLRKPTHQVAEWVAEEYGTRGVWRLSHGRHGFPNGLDGDRTLGCRATKHALSLLGIRCHLWFI